MIKILRNLKVKFGGGAAGGGGGGAVDSVNGQTGIVILTADNISDAATTNKFTDAAGLTLIGTAIQPGNAALTDAREWTAATVDQAEAEAGSATTRRAWTSQRVRQAILAVTGAVGTTVGRAIFALTNPSAIRFLRINADNSVTARTAAEMRSDLGITDLISYSPQQLGAATALATQRTVFNAAKNYTIVSLQWIHTQNSSVPGVTLTVTIDNNSAAPGSGTTVCVIALDSGQLVQLIPALSATAIAAGQRISITLSGTATDLLGCNMTVELAQA